MLEIGLVGGDVDGDVAWRVGSGRCAGSGPWLPISKSPDSLAGGPQTTHCSVGLCSVCLLFAKAHSLAGRVPNQRDVLWATGSM